MIEAFSEHPTAANLLMMAMLTLGAFGLIKLNEQFFPSIKVPVIAVTVAWQGASAGDVETQILNAIDPGLRSIDGVTIVRSMAREGSALFTIEFAGDADMQKAQSDVERAVSLVTTLPIDSERPLVRAIAFYEPVGRLIVTGDVGEDVLKHFAYRVRDELIAQGIDQVEFVGTRTEELTVLVDDARRRELDLTLDEVASQIKRATNSIPSGTLQGSQDIQIRTAANLETIEGIGQIEVRATDGGHKLHVRDVARIETRFDREGVIGRHNGRPAIELRVKRALTADTLETTDIMERVAGEMRRKLPGSLEIITYAVEGRHLRDRLLLVVENGLQGFVLVILVLMLFLNGRIAFWVAVGIPVSIMFALGVMWLAGQSLNMISLFALIMMVGIIVDDAIVVGEHTGTMIERGLPANIASGRAASEMLLPVMAATLTTQFAFLPVLAFTGPFGQVMQVIPIVVFSVLLASTVECFLVLPNHLRHASLRKDVKPTAFRAAFDRVFARVRDHYLRRVLDHAYNWRYSVLAALTGLLVVGVTVVTTGHIKVHFFASPEAELLRASVIFTPGLRVEMQKEVLTRYEQALRQAEVELAGVEGKLVAASFTTIGSFEAFERIRLHNVAQIDVELTPTEERSVRTPEIIERWQALVPLVAGVTTMAISPIERGPPVRAIELILSDAPLEVLKAAAEEVGHALSTYHGVNAVIDDLPYGKPEKVMRLTPKGRALGFTIEDVGLQVRHLVEGAEAKRFVRGDEEIVIKVVRDPKDNNQPLHNVLIRSPQGQWVQLGEVVDIQQVDSFSIIRHVDGRRTVTVSADVDSRVAAANEIVAAVGRDVMPNLARKYGMAYKFAGQNKELSTSLQDMLLASMLSLAFIFGILAYLYQSYSQPLVIMFIIPYSLVGAIGGHMIFGLDLSLPSLVGLLGLMGMVVNDSIVLIERASSLLRNGQSARDAAIGACQDRLRAVLLTSITTIFGLIPLLFETSRQAQFLVPLAVTIIFGLITSTIITLLLTPILFGIGSDLSRTKSPSASSVRRTTPTPLLAEDSLGS